MLTFLVVSLLYHVWFMVPLWQAQAQVSPACVYNNDKKFDFEVKGEENCFKPTPPKSGTVTRSNKMVVVKHGSHSLKWVAFSASRLKLELKLQTRPGSEIPNDWLRRGGVKVWFYKERPSPGKTLTVEFKNSRKPVARFQANLDFEGWRGVWVKFDECKIDSASLKKPTVINEVNFVLNGADTIYIDFLQFLKSIGGQSRDKVVPPISPFGLEIYGIGNTWQQTYKWSQQAIPPLPSTVDKSKKISLELIESRLINWYCAENKTSPHFPSGSFLRRRWNSLSRIIKKAHEEYDTLDLDSISGKVIGPPLFCRDCRGSEKFGTILEKILLPLSLEFYIRSRSKEIKDTVAAFLGDLNSDAKGNALKAIAGDNKNMINQLKSYFPPSGRLTPDLLKKAIIKLNLHRLNKINNILDYIKQQGFADGSGLGSLDHEWNRNGAGFMHSLFLIKGYLKNKSKLLDLIKTAKWFNEFGEIYQSPSFEIKGTTADRMITLMLFRLMTVLVMPSSTDDEIKAKIRDMEALVRWMNNALAVNEGLGGVIKPDFVGYHHKAFYGPAYVPQALHTAALVYYLLGGTEFALSASSENNIRRGLETMRIIAVKYSTPNSVNGRMPSYSNKKILILLPAFAYISVSHPCTEQSEIAASSTVSTNKPEMFLRLYNDTTVNSYLEDGGYKVKYYYNSLGSLDIMEAVKDNAKLRGIYPESSPEGHWSKNFAALSIHRRKNWAVTVKGFNRFLWDFENKKNENVFGMFASHGALLIANSETSLKVHDVENGWDWTKVPGATTLALDLNALKLKKGRFYNPKDLVGGLTFKGTSILENGIFGMDFEQPNYSLSDWRKKIDFEFKKSVFFFENLLVCLGSDIVAKNTGGKIVQTTLFQDKLTESLSIKINGVVKRLSTSISKSTPSKQGQKFSTLTDTKGNFYYIPDASKDMLKVHIKNQISKTEDGKTATFGKYGTAWLEHVGFPSQYEYAVIIPTTTYSPTPYKLASAQETKMKAYNVLEKSKVAHVVQFVILPKTWTPLNHPVTAYVIFQPSSSLPTNGPVAEVNRGNILIMVEENVEFIHLSISSPSINLEVKRRLNNSGDAREEELYQSSSRERNITVTLKTPVQRSIVSLMVHDDPDSYKPNVWVDDAGQQITFLNLKNGFSVEVKLKKKPKQKSPNDFPEAVHW